MIVGLDFIIAFLRDWLFVIHIGIFFMFILSQNYPKFVPYFVGKIKKNSSLYPLITPAKPSSRPPVCDCWSRN